MNERFMYARRIVELTLFVCLGMTGQLLSSDGDLDSTFGVRGRTTPALSGHARAVVLQPDEKIVVVGWTEPYHGSDFAVTVYTLRSSELVGTRKIIRVEGSPPIPSVDVLYCASNG
jgi:hypothetical protein